MNNGDVVGGGDISTCVREAILGDENRSLWDGIDGAAGRGGGRYFHEFAGAYHIRRMANRMDMGGWCSGRKWRWWWPGWRSGEADGMTFEWCEVCGRNIVRVLAVVSCRLGLCVISIALFFAAVLFVGLSVLPKIDIISPAVFEIDALSGMVGVAMMA